jgi:CubicO group peptidase (beta-lactamase class C family)
LHSRAIAVSLWKHRFMKKSAPILLLLVFTALFGFGQGAAVEKNDSVFALVVRYMNEKALDSLYSLTGELFKKNIQWEQFKTITSNNLFPLGKIQETHLIKTTGNVSAYKTVYASTSLTMSVGLDSLRKLQTFFFQPYVDESLRKTGKIGSDNPLVTAQDKMVDSVAMGYIRRLPPVGLSIGILQGGKTSFYGYGETVKGNGKVPDVGTLFEIGSISKTFTATMLGLAVGEGKIKLDDPVNRYLPDSIPSLQYEGKEATIRTLSNHTSGLPRMPGNFQQTVVNGKDPYGNYTIRDLYHFLHDLKLGRAPGSEFEYSNLAVGLLGTILQKEYNKGYEELLLSLVARPLGMADTRVNIRPVDSARFASGYDDKGVYNGPWNLSAAFAGAGAIRSTARDMLKYAAAEMGGPGVPAPLAQAMQLTHSVTFQDGRNRIGLGWILLTAGGEDILFHNGGTGGYRSWVGINLKKKIAVVVLSNCGIGVDEEGMRMMSWLEKVGSDGGR